MWKGALLALVLCAAAFGQNAHLEGTAIDASTGRPLGGVHVLVFIPSAGSPAKAYGALTDSAGRFSIGGIAPGSYYYLGERAGFVTVPKGGGRPFPPVILKAGDRITDFKLEMTPRATISGRVLDEFGDPVQSVQVQLMAASSDTPVPLLTTGLMQTDDRGEYRLTVPPGKYRLLANATRFSTPEVRTDGTTPTSYVPTWYPDTPTSGRAAPVEAAAGAALTGIDIRLSQRAGGATAGGVDGTVTGLPDTRGWAAVHLVSRDSTSGSTFQQTTQTRPDGKFSFQALRPGRYQLFARYTLDNKALTSQVVEFDDASPPSGVVLRLAPAPEIIGSLAFDAEGVPEVKRTVQLRPLRPVMANSPASGQTEAGHTFRIAGVFPDRYRVSVSPLPENTYIRSVEIDGAPVAPEDLDLSRGAGRLKVIIGHGAAQVSGYAVDRDGSRVLNTLGAVLLLRDRERLDLTNDEQIMRLPPDGAYAFKGLRPGKYWLLAIDAIRSAIVNSPDELKKFTALAEEVELKPGDRLRKDVKIVTQEALDAKK